MKVTPTVWLLPICLLPAFSTGSKLAAATKAAYPNQKAPDFSGACWNVSIKVQQ